MFFRSGPTTSSSGETRPPPTADLKNSQEWSGCSVEITGIISVSFLHEAVPGTPGHAYKEIAQIADDLTTLQGQSKDII